MLESKTEVSRARKQQGASSYGMLQTKVIRVTAPVLAIAGWLATIAPGITAPTSYNNDYRACAARLLNVGVSAEAAAAACATALRPRELSACVFKISKEAKISGVDALATCRQARRPEELATCVVGVSQNTEEAAKPAILNYCGRSLLPLRFAQCVLGLRSEIKSTVTQTLDICIDGSDRIGSVTPGSAPPTQRPTEFRPTFETTPIPAQPGSK